MKIVIEEGVQSLFLKIHCFDKKRIPEELDGGQDTQLEHEEH